MGRRPTRSDAVPRLRIRKKGRKVWYYYDHGGKPRREEPLGCDYGLAIKRWAELERAGDDKPGEVITFRYVANKYRAEVIPLKAAATQKDNARELKQLFAFFDDPPGPINAIQPVHVAQYLRWRGQKAKVRANREKALLSHIWNWARSVGYTTLPNPCAGIKGHREDGRDVYIEDAMFNAVWNAASVPLRDAMDLAYLCGQRVADTLKMDERDIQDGFLQVLQGKGKVRRRIAVQGELELLLDRIAARKRGYVVRTTRLVVAENGQAMTYDMLHGAFCRARGSANVDFELFQFRDLRAKAATDKADSSGDIRQAQQQLGHTTIGMTQHYVRNRRGAKVTPTK